MDETTASDGASPVVASPDAPRHGWRWGLAWATAAAGLAVLAVLLARQASVFGPPVVDLGPTSIAVLDTVSFAGRTVRAHLDGVVEDVEPDGTVWLAARGLSFPVALGAGAVADSLGIHPERRLLVVGRLRGADGRRWLDADAWTLVEGAVVSPAADTVRFGPAADTVRVDAPAAARLASPSAARLAPAGDRSDTGSDRSAAAR